MMVRKEKQEAQSLGWTSISQSKKLLEAGLDPGTADMYWYRTYGDYPDGYKDFIVVATESRGSKEDVPAWSLGKLIDLVNKSHYHVDWLVRFTSKIHTPIENAIDAVITCIEQGYISRKE